MGGGSTSQAPSKNGRRFSLAHECRGSADMGDKSGAVLHRLRPRLHRLIRRGYRATDPRSLTMTYPRPPTLTASPSGRGLPHLTVHGCSRKPPPCNQSQIRPRSVRQPISGGHSPTPPSTRCQQQLQRWRFLACKRVCSPYPPPEYSTGIAPDCVPVPNGRPSCSIPPIVSAS